MISAQIHRVTLFKIPSKDDQTALLEMYKSMKSKATKDGKSYIVAVEAGPTHDDTRNQGYTVVAKSTFASKEDFDYYDKECAAHKELKAFAGSKHQGLCMVCFNSVT